MKKINVTINGIMIQGDSKDTILETAKKNNIRIPHLCHLKIDSIYTNDCASCRICVVEVDGREGLYPSCSTKIWEGMNVITNSVEIMKIRKNVLELILANHPKDCLVCRKSGDCELQKLSNEMRIKEIRYDSELRGLSEDRSAAIIRDMDKCIMCRRCETMCNNVQSCNILSGINRGSSSIVSTYFNKKLSETYCTFCGQCVAVCPVGALTEHDYTWDVINSIANKDKIVVAQIAPAVRVALGEEFNIKIGTNIEKKIVAALKKLGFDYIFDTSWAADLTIMEEASELKNRLVKHFQGDKEVKLPLLTSCCPAWMNFLEDNFPTLVEVPSTAKSPMQMCSSVIKNIWGPEKALDKKNIVVVSIMPCLAKKYESQREEFIYDGIPDTDYSITTRELAHMIKSSDIDFENLEDKEFDSPMGSYSGAGIIFGRTGGVIEAATRTTYKFITGNELDNLEFTSMEGIKGTRIAEIEIAGNKIRIGITHGLGEARKLLEKIVSGEEFLHGIEIMACKGGCVGGGGQPYTHGNYEIIKARMEALSNIDKCLKIRKSHENPDVLAIYEKHLGVPLSAKAKELLHNHKKR
ncbi:MAG: NADH-dependent [FeFe] hydrogenase, group A6 [Fusobacteriaceae bacterium]